MVFSITLLRRMKLKKDIKDKEARVKELKREKETPIEE